MNGMYDLVVMGDINLDWVCSKPIGFPFSSLVNNGVIEWAEMDEKPGGSGLNFAVFAREMGFTPLLLGRVGEDPAGDFIISRLHPFGLTNGIRRMREAGTGKAFIVRDSHNIRFLVNNEPNANRLLTATDVERHAQDIAQCRVLYISGYCVQFPNAPRKRATQRAIAIAREAGSPRVVFDVVPHQIYKIYNFDEFLALTKGVDILISEAATMRRYLGMGDRSETIDREMVEATAAKLADYYPSFILRFGPSGCDEQAIWRGAGHELVWEVTGHDQAVDKRGFGDRVALGALVREFGLGPH